MADQDKLLRTKGFKVTISNAGAAANADKANADSFWRSVSGGADVIEKIESTHGNEQFKTFTPGHSQVTQLVLEGGMTDTRKDLIQWIQDQMEGKEFRRMVTVTPLKTDGTDAPQHVYHDCFVEEYTFPLLDAENHDTLIERVTIHALRHTVGSEA